MEISLLENPVRDGFALANIAVFLVVGVWLLHRRFALLEELSPRAQVVVVCWAALTCGVELIVLRGTLQRTPVLYIFTAIGFFVAAFALYGHVGVSLLSKLLVDTVLHPGDDGVERPRTGSAEALERLGDHGAAAREYLALARIYPGDPELWISAGGNFVQLGQPHEAAACFEKAIALLRSPGEALLVFWRCAAVLQREAGGAAKCAALAEGFAHRFAGSREAETVTAWLEKTTLGTPGSGTPKGAGDPDKEGGRAGEEMVLERLEDHPLEDSDRI